MDIPGIPDSDYKCSKDDDSDSFRLTSPHLNVTVDLVKQGSYNPLLEASGNRPNITCDPPACFYWRRERGGDEFSKFHVTLGDGERNWRIDEKKDVSWRYGVLQLTFLARPKRQAKS